MTRIGYPAIILLVAFGIVLRYALQIQELKSDAGSEFTIYSFIVDTGKWEIQPNFRLGSACLFTTFFPAMFQRTFGTDLLMTFNLFPCFIIPFLPVVVYYLAKKWVSPFYAFLVSGFVIGQIYFLGAPAFSRIMVALVFFSLALLVVFNKDMRFRTKIGLSVLLSLCMVTAHYGVTFGSLGVIGGVIAVTVALKIVRRYHYPNLWALFGFWAILLAGAIVWLGIINVVPLAWGTAVVKKSVDMEADVLVVPGIVVPPGVEEFVPEGAEEGVPIVVTRKFDFFSLKSRDEVIQVAFGKTLPTMNIPQKIEFASSWLTILLMTWGLIVATRRWGIREEWILMMLACYSAIVIWVVLPAVGYAYGIARVYFQMVIVLAPCFIIGVLDVAKRMRTPALLVLLFVLMPYVLCTSGIMHTFFGLAR